MLRRVLIADAVVTGANGVVYLAGAAALDSFLGLPTTLLAVLGVVLVAFAAVVWYVGSRPEIQPAAVGGLVAANAAWTAASLLVLVTDAFSPTTEGSVWIGLQAVGVAGVAALQLIGLRRAV